MRGLVERGPMLVERCPMLLVCLSVVSFVWSLIC